MTALDEQLVHRYAEIAEVHDGADWMVSLADWKRMLDKYGMAAIVEKDGIVYCVGPVAWTKLP